MTILPQLERDLSRAAQQRLTSPDDADALRDQPRHDRPRSTGRGPRIRRRLAKTATAVPVVLAIVVAVIIAAFALTLGHRDHQSQPTTPATSVQAARQQLVQMLGILRRPQTKADLDRQLTLGFGLERLLARFGHPKLDRALMRVIKIPAWHAKVGIEPTTWQPSPSSPQRSEGVDLELWIGPKSTIPPSSDQGTGPRPTRAGVIRSHGLALASSAGGNLLDGVVLVPDGVAKVTLRVSRVIDPPVKVNPSQFGTATAAVHDNIAAFQLTLPHVTVKKGLSGMFGTPGVLQTTWFDARGNVIKHTTTHLDVVITVKGNRAFPSRPRDAGTHRARSR